ncbi:Rv3654c family TadE-like protein [uncultured Bifidobacterium sp.]|uniref:Rv3654c family TadE-like protein n=1 Tax=uncultured Bifidobacterium sp. TaxID=165187 RepID=UPI0028DCFBDE|nr:Rv3654c family TadE-like protein [uncultured Bifidobacterium sp.]
MMPIRGADASQRGSGTVLALVVLMAGGVLLSVVACAANLLGASSTATSAADMAALAAATARLTGSDDPCSAARGVADHYGVRVTGCHLDGEDVIVTVTAFPGMRALPDVDRSARAGPRECE